MSLFRRHTIKALHDDPRWGPVPVSEDEEARPCERCGQPAGKRCRKPNGSLAGGPHRVRRTPPPS